MVHSMIGPKRRSTRFGDVLRRHCLLRHCLDIEECISCSLRLPMAENQWASDCPQVGQELDTSRTELGKDMSHTTSGRDAVADDLGSAIRTSRASSIKRMRTNTASMAISLPCTYAIPPMLRRVGMQYSDASFSGRFTRVDALRLLVSKEFPTRVSVNGCLQRPDGKLVYAG